TDGAARVAGAPQIALDVRTDAVRPALHAVDHEVAEELLVGQLVVGADVEHVHVALAARAGVAGAFARADHVELLVVGREAEPVGIRHLLLGDDEIHLADRIDAIHAGRKLALVLAHAERLAEPRLETTRGVARPARGVRRALVELAAIRRIREPGGAVRMRHDLLRRAVPPAPAADREHR